MVRGSSICGQRFIHPSHGRHQLVPTGNFGIPGSAEERKDQDARLALSPLAAMAERTKCAVLVIRHLNKAQGGSAIYRGGGSIGITGAARLVLLAAKNPDKSGEFVLASVKNNLGPPCGSVTYSIACNHNAAVVAWGGKSDHTADSLLAFRDPTDAPEREEAEDYLRAALGHGARPQAEVEADAKQAGISQKTLRRAKKALAVKSNKIGWDGKWHWSLPDGPEKVATFEDGHEDGQQPRASSAGPFSAKYPVTSNTVATFDE